MMAFIDETGIAIGVTLVALAIVLSVTTPAIERVVRRVRFGGRDYRRDLAMVGRLTDLARALKTRIQTYTQQTNQVFAEARIQERKRTALAVRKARAIDGLGAVRVIGDASRGGAWCCLVVNRAVQEANGRKETHEQYDGTWAEAQAVVVRALSADQAERRAYEVFPRPLGFEVVSTVEAPAVQRTMLEKVGPRLSAKARAGGAS
jgi:hypothetical protein